MNKDNKNILIYASVLKALEHLDKLDMHPSSDQRNIDAAIQRLEDIKSISKISLNDTHKKLMETGPHSEFLNTQGRSKEKVKHTEDVAIIAVLACVAILSAIAFFA